MKKSILVIVLAFFGFTTMSGQEYVRFGAKGGVNFTNMTSDGFDDTNSRTGFHLGLLGEIPLSDAFSIQPEVLYSTQGAEATIRGLGNADNGGEFRLDYIQVPVLAKIHLFQGRALEGLSIEIGPSFNFLVNDEIADWTDSPSFTTDSLFSSFEFGGAVGASFNFPGGFFASARYARGFTSVFNSDNWDEDAVNNNGFQLGVGFMF